MKKIQILAMSATLLVAVATTSFANELRARIKSVDLDKNTITVIEGQKDYVFSVSADTKFLNLKGGDLRGGFRSNDLKEGRRVIVDYAASDSTSDGVMALQSLQIRQ